MYDPDAKLPAHLAARLVGVSRQLINYWRTSGILQPAARASRGYVYRLADVLEAERTTRRSPNSRRAA
jgi:DNA-binding transcriptional MerR regulator